MRRRPALLLLLIACGACAADDARDVSDASEDTSDPSVGDFDVGAFSWDATWDATHASWDSRYDPPWGDAPDAMPRAPALRCGTRHASVDGGRVDVGADPEPCAPPPSVCADAWWLVYFTNGSCVHETCLFEEATLLCPDGCERGGCRRGPTAI